MGIRGTEAHFMRTRFVTAYAQGVFSCLVTCAKSGEGVSLSVPSQLAVKSRFDRAENALGQGQLVDISVNGTGSSNRYL